MRQNEKPTRSRVIAGALLVALASAGAARAEGPTAGSGKEVILSGYLFASGLKGRASTTPGLPPANINLSFRDVLDDLDFGFMSAVEVRNGRWGYMGDIMYSHVTPSGTVPGPLPVSAGLDQKSLTVQGNVYYRVHESAQVNVDLGLGLRYWNVDNAGTVAPGSPASIGFSHTESWIDPVIGARMNAKISGPWSVTLAGDVGGSGAGSDLTWQLQGTVNFQKNDKFAFYAGYRVLAVDYKQSGFTYDVTMRGPVIGMSVRF